METKTRSDTVQLAFSSNSSFQWKPTGRSPQHPPWPTCTLSYINTFVFHNFTAELTWLFAHLRKNYIFNGITRVTNTTSRGLERNSLIWMERTEEYAFTSFQKKIPHSPHRPVPQFSSTLHLPIPIFGTFIKLLCPVSIYSTKPIWTIHSQPSWLCLS